MLPEVEHTVVVDDSDHQLGFTGAVAEGWRQALATGADYLFHAELDFTYNRPVPLAGMIDTLRTCPHLVQMALLRQPVNQQEIAAGGIIAMHLSEYYPRRQRRGHRWLEHRHNVTTNPSVWPRWVIELGWPQCERSEGVFGAELFASDSRLRAAYWGEGEEWVTHVGHVRTGTGY